MLTKKHFETLAHSIAMPMEFTISMYARSFEGDFAKSVIEYGPLHDLKSAISITAMSYSSIASMCMNDNPRFDADIFNSYIKSEAIKIAGYASEDRKSTTAVSRILAEAMIFTEDDEARGPHYWVTFDYSKVVDILLEVMGVEVEPMITEFNLV